MFRQPIAMAAQMAAITLAALTLAGCGVTPVSLDNPLSGAEVSLSVDQPLSVRLSNVAAAGQWSLEGEAPDAVQSVDADVRAAAAGVRQLESFNFIGVAPGEDTLTFVYRRPGVEASAGEVDSSDVITVSVKVS